MDSNECRMGGNLILIEPSDVKGDEISHPF